MNTRSTHAALALGLVLTMSAVANSSLAEELPPELASAFASTPAVDLNRWRFSETRTRDGEVRLRKYDPRNTPQWRLVSINGEPPDAEALAEHDEQVAKQAKQESGRPGENDFRGLAAKGSWKLREQSESKSVWQFTPAASGDIDEAMAKKLQGELIIDRLNNRVDSFRLFSLKPFRVKLIARIQSIDTRFQMETIAPGVEFASAIDFTIQGRALGLKKIDEQSQIRYTQFEPVEVVE